MGRHNHENDVAIPGFDDLVVLSGDDTFTSGPLTESRRSGRYPIPGLAPAQSQLYSYIAPDTDSLLERRGRPLGLRLRHGRREELLRRRSGGRRRRSTGPLHQGAQEHRHRARHRRVGAEGGRHRLPAAARRTAAGNETFAPCASARHRRPAVGARVLEPDINNVFQFVRVEDIAYDNDRQTTSSTSSTRARPDRCRARSDSRHAVPIHERPCLEDGARSERSDGRDLAHRAGRGRRQPSQDARPRSISRTTSSRRPTASS